MSESYRVYLDHHIARENLRYRRPQESFSSKDTQKPITLPLNRLTDDNYNRYLRKPDFQRATWAWNSDDCISLLDSIIRRQVIPSIIMWTSPDNGLDYILDGGHRISVVIAWLKDDWGYEYAKNFDNPDDKKMIQRAASEVSAFVQSKIGHIREYRNAETKIQEIIDAGLSPKDRLDALTFERGRFYQDFLKGYVSFNILWVPGNYSIAEQSFLKINKSGRQLSDWETKLIENRDSSFARAVMSIASLHSAPYYWPELSAESSDDPKLNQKISEILDGITDLQAILFEPKPQRPVTRLEQPFLWATAEMKPYYVAELLTVTEGFRGQVPETKILLERDKDASPEQIIINGHELVTKGIDIFSHLIGLSPKSLEIVPALYFYTPEGRHVRSLLYGFIRWLFDGDDKAVLDRKRVFSVYREFFEYMLRMDKKKIVQTFGRKIGSGPEVTIQTAHYYQGLLELLVDYQGDIQSDTFLDSYAEFTSNLAGKRTREETTKEIRSRIFTEKQKSATVLEAFFTSAIHCEICGGLFNPGGNLQHDHILKWEDGGETSTDNERLTHPFCNNQRIMIEQYQNGVTTIKLPRFVPTDDPDMLRQLSFFDDVTFTE